MSRKRDLSMREEIAKQFLLPERQSKINTLLRQDGQAYCICRSSDSSRFMIACDACEEWYHGDCINISEKEAKLIKQYFCIRCTEEDNSLITRWKTRHSSSSTHHDPIATTAKTTPTSAATATPSSSSHRSRKQQRKEQRRYNYDGDYEPPDETTLAEPLASGVQQAHYVKSHRQQQQHGSRGGGSSGGGSGKRCNDCMGCLRTADCGRCDVCQQQHGGGGGGRHRERCKQRICINYGGISNRKRRNSSSDRDGTAGPHNAHLQTTYARQCYGPACTVQARYGSKYCSDTCGSRLATNRIFQVLPQRIQEWALSPCQAEDKNIKALDTVRKQQSEVRSVLHELDQRHRELDAVLERARRATVDPLVDADGDDETTAAAAEVSIYCITCGLEIHSRTAIKHMEKCFNKYESQASFGSIFKTKIEGNNMFCDYFNPGNHTYCKRLRVLCPEHCKDAKVGDHEVCGCPLVTNVFSLTGEFCHAPKKSCGKHHVWEKLRRAEIDLERVRQWLKMDELLERERQIRQAMASRAGVLALMLHSTYNHEVMEEITRASHQDNHAMQRELAKRFTATKTTSRQ